LTIYDILLTIYYILFIIYYLLYTIIIYYVLYTIYYILFIIYYLLYTIDFTSSITCVCSMGWTHSEAYQEVILLKHTLGGGT